MDIRDIKKEFMTYRNGVIADTLRQAGWPHKIIFGLNLPQLTEIARSLLVPDPELAQSLWADREVRESRLLASFLFDPQMAEEEVKKVCADVRTREEADLLAFRWLRKHPCARQLAEYFATQDYELQRYLANAIRRFLED